MACLIPSCRAVSTGHENFVAMRPILINRSHVRRLRRPGGRQDLQAFRPCQLLKDCGPVASRHGRRPARRGMRDRQMPSPVVVTGPIPSCSRVKLRPGSSCRRSIDSNAISLAPSPADTRSVHHPCAVRVTKTCYIASSSRIARAVRQASPRRWVGPEERSRHPRNDRWARHRGPEPRACCPDGSSQRLPGKSTSR